MPPVSSANTKEKGPLLAGRSESYVKSRILDKTKFELKRGEVKLFEQKSVFACCSLKGYSHEDFADFWSKLC